MFFTMLSVCFDFFISLLQFPNGYVELNHFTELLKVDSSNGGLRAVPKLSVNHVEPNNLQRMNVRLAVQVVILCGLLCIY